MALKIKLAYGDMENIKILFTEYTQLLVDTNSNFENYLSLQNYDDEIENIDVKYGLPNGRLYGAYLNEHLVGCIALRKLSEAECEMKRLYVRPKFRGYGTAKKLVDIIIADAKNIGYGQMLLDTLPELKSAIKLYERFGFYKILPYNDSPIEDTVFMKLDL
ncbi:MAG: GNAT family N-acetyltransferase [Defluviitaleaceae bacterium]|nr:GNAT family N-acetyltransferase [Defluviitaleaceae bacterium]